MGPTNSQLEPPGVEKLRGGLAVAMRLAELHAGDDAKLRELVAAALHTFKATVHIHCGGASDPPGVMNTWRCSKPSRSPAAALQSGEVHVVGEGDRGRAQLDHPRAGPLH